MYVMYLCIQVPVYLKSLRTSCSPIIVCEEGNGKPPHSSHPQVWCKSQWICLWAENHHHHHPSMYVIVYVLIFVHMYVGAICLLQLCFDWTVGKVKAMAPYSGQPPPPSRSQRPLTFQYGDVIVVESCSGDWIQVSRASNNDILLIRYRLITLPTMFRSWFNFDC